MSLIGDIRISIDGGPNLGDFVTSLQRTTPATITTIAANRDWSAVPKRGHGLVLAGVEEDLTPGTLWRALYDRRNEKDVPITWSTQDGGIGWAGVMAVVPDPSQGGQANQHGAFNIPIPLVAAPTLIDPTTDPTWTIAITGTPAGGTYDIRVNELATAPLAYDANLAAILAAINALSGVTGLAAVTGSGTGPWALTFPVPVSVAVSHAFTGGTSPAITATP